jgi:hypothetical protein
MSSTKPASGEVAYSSQQLDATSCGRQCTSDSLCVAYSYNRFTQKCDQFRHMPKPATDSCCTLYVNTCPGYSNTPSKIIDVLMLFLNCTLGPDLCTISVAFIHSHTPSLEFRESGVGVISRGWVRRGKMVGTAITASPRSATSFITCPNLPLTAVARFM